MSGLGLAGFDINLTTWDVIWTTCLQGLGVGFIWVPLSMITFSTLNPQYMPDGTAIFHLLRNIGSSIHISLSIALIIRLSKVNYADMVQYLSPTNENFALPWVSGGWSLETNESLAAPQQRDHAPGHMIGYIDAFYLFAVTAMLAVPCVLVGALARQASLGRQEMSDKIQGIMPPMTTPFGSDSELDEGAVRSQVEFLIGAGVHGVAVGGSTGEGHTLDGDELRHVVAATTEAVNGRVPVIAGIIVDSTRDAIMRGNAVADLGVAALQVTPVHYLQARR